MHFRMLGLDPRPFLPLFGLDEAALRERHVLRVSVDAPDAYPDRIELRDGAPGESMLLLNHVSLDVPTPYRATHAIYVREGACDRFEQQDVVPEALRRRLLSVRAFDGGGMMVDADVTEGRELELLIERLFSNPAAAFLHVHHARRGCYAARIERR